MLVLSALVTVILKLTWTNVKVKTRKWNAQRWRMAKRGEIQTRVSWRVSLCCSTALSQFPSQNYFKTEKNLQAENFIFYYQRTIVPKRGGFKNRQVGEFHEVI